MKHLQPNSLLQGGKYRIVRFLSSGGFGNTYEGVHTMMDTRVAIKEFFPKMFCNRDENTSHVTVATQGNRELVDKLRKKFNEEAKAVFQMKHDNIVRVLDIFEENGTAYYVMEYIDGKSLNDITKERGALPESEAVGYIRQVADALKYVHSLNRLHLDIKPGNIMIDKNGKAILIDFGASKHYDDESGENTSTLMGVNTKGYAPIEQSTQSFTSFSPATDIYALGATFYKLLTGIVPPDANLLLAEEETLQPLSNNITVSTRNAVTAAMQLRRKDRPQSSVEFVAMLSEKQSVSTNIKASHSFVTKKNIAVDEGTIIETNNKPRSKSPKSHKADQEIKDEAWEILKKYSLGFREYNDEYEGSLDDVNYCRMVVRDKSLIMRRNKRLSSEQDSDTDAQKQNKKNEEAASQKISPKEEIIMPQPESVPKKKNWKKILIFFFVIFAAIVIPIVYNLIEQGPKTVTNQIYHLHGEDVSYTGDVEYDVPNGYGTALYKRGQYQGYFVNGMRFGEGTFKDVDGGVFIGIFANDEYSKGKYTKKDGTYFEGTFLNQQPYNGILYKKDGTVVGYVNEKVFSEPQPAKKNTKKNAKKEEEYVPYKSIYEGQEYNKPMRFNATY